MRPSLRLEGIAAAPGIAISQVQAIDRKKLLIPRNTIAEEMIDEELARLLLAVEDARKQIQKTIDSLPQSDDPGGIHKNHSMILQTHLLLLGDILLIDNTADLIRSRKLNAEWALSIVADDMIEQLTSADNEYLAERAEDIGFVKNRILRNLLGHDDDLLDGLHPAKECIIVTVDLSPAETAQMISSPIMGFATEKGTQTSHTAIMAQAMGLPAVVGVDKLTEKVNPGDTIIVDGLDGIIIISPDDETLALYQDRANQWAAMESRLRSTKDEPSITTDGQKITLKGNIELPAEATFALDNGAEGIGLYRTEFLYLDREYPPDRDEQIKTYTSVVKAVSPATVVFRTFDLGADKMPRCLHLSHARNPAMGMRAIRIGLRRYPDLLKEQIKAIIIATANAGREDAWIMFPLVSGVAEFQEVHQMVNLCKKELGLEQPDLTLPHIKVGCMIELPSAVFLCDLLAEEADFFSIGTNDLIQYMMAIDRVNDDVAYLYSHYHPSALRALKKVVDAAQKAHIPVSICGGAAGAPNMTPLLIGLGLTELSAAPHSIPFVKAAVRTISFEEAKKLTDKALSMRTAQEIEALAVKFMQGKMDIVIN